MSAQDWEGNELAQDDPDEQRVLFGALDSYYQYAKVAHFNTTHLRRQSFYALPRAHLEILAAPPFSYLDTLNAVDDAIDKNAELSLAIWKAGLESFGMPPQVDILLPKDVVDWRGKATSNDLEKARSTLRQFYRDWSAEGDVEREACYRPVLRALQEERKSRGVKLRVLVPGAGLARLVFDLCCAGFDTEGNEISYHQLLASSYILNHCHDSHAHTLYPWVHSFSNHRTRANHLKSVQIPEIHPSTVLGSVENPGQMSMSASDFLLLYGDKSHRETFDAVATVFFLVESNKDFQFISLDYIKRLLTAVQDTAPNIIRYIEAIKNCLRPGGLFINVGPLLWHFENNAPGQYGRGKGTGSETTNQNGPMGIADPGAVELTDDEVVALIEKLGFVVEKREFGLTTPYIQDPESMLQNSFKASHWVARKR